MKALSLPVGQSYSYVNLINSNLSLAQDTIHKFTCLNSSINPENFEVKKSQLKKCELTKQSHKVMDPAQLSLFYQQMWPQQQQQLQSSDGFIPNFLIPQQGNSPPDLINAQSMPQQPNADQQQLQFALFMQMQQMMSGMAAPFGQIPINMPIPNASQPQGDVQMADPSSSNKKPTQKEVADSARRSKRQAVKAKLKSFVEDRRPEVQKEVSTPAPPPSKLNELMQSVASKRDSGQKHEKQAKKYSKISDILATKKELLKQQVQTLELQKKNNYHDSIFCKENDQDDGIVCDVCREEDWSSPNPDACEGTIEKLGNQILVCENCNVGVHQFCYQRELVQPGGIPEDDWFCERCKILKQYPQLNPAELCCDLCNDLKGIIIEYTHAQTGQKGWGHITCINWVPDIYFTDESATTIEGQLNVERFNLNCYVCRRSKLTGGCCLQCDYKECMQGFHVRCAIYKGLIKSIDQMEGQIQDEETSEVFLFCDKHLAIGVREFKLGGRDRITKPSIMKKTQNKQQNKQQLINNIAEEAKEQQDEDQDAEMDDGTAGGTKSRRRNPIMNNFHANRKRQYKKTEATIATSAIIPIPNVAVDFGDSPRVKKGMKTKKTGKQQPSNTLIQQPLTHFNSPNHSTAPSSQDPQVPHCQSGQPSSAILQPSQKYETKYYIDREFAEYIGITHNEYQCMTRKKLTDAFITYAIQQKIVNIHNKEYDLSSSIFLQKKLGAVRVPAPQLINYLASVMTKIDMPQNNTPSSV